MFSFRKSQDDTANKDTPNAKLGPILRQSPSPPARRLRAALMLVKDETIQDMAHALGRNRAYLQTVIAYPTNSRVLARKIAAYIGVEVNDIWPSHDARLSDGTHKSRKNPTTGVTK